MTVLVCMHAYGAVPHGVEFVITGALMLGCYVVDDVFGVGWCQVDGWMLVGDAMSGETIW